MKTLKYILAGVCSVFMLSGCLSQFQDLNTDDELLGRTDPRNVFTGATENFNNCTRSHLTGKYSGVMIYMQYLVNSGGPNAGAYVDQDKPNNHPEPFSPAYHDYYDRFGLKLDYLINTVIPNDPQAERYQNVKHISQILLSYEQWRILDTFGAAPITEAFRDASEGIRTPRYDLYQMGIDGTPMYKKIDADIKAAVEGLKASDDKQYELGNNDFFYNGDVQKWIKFGNTVRVKMAQRLEKMDKQFYNSVISEVLSSAGNIIASHEESCIYHHPNDYNNNPDDIQDITSRYCASKAFVNFLKEYDDPRLPIMVRPNGFGEGNNNELNDDWFEKFKKEYPDYESKYPQFLDRYVGLTANPDNATDELTRQAYLTLKYHKEDGKEANLDIRMYSQAESRYYIKNGGVNGNNNMPAREIESPDFEINLDNMHTFTPIITYPETCFMLAEIAIKKGSSVAGKDATAWYREGIKASMQQYAQWATDMYVIAQTAENAMSYAPVTDAKISAYLAKPEFQTATLEKIISQQWINLYMQPEEMWATWKRTGLPAFKADPVPVEGVGYLEKVTNDDKELIIPRRNILYTPNTLNLPNFEDAVSKMLEDAKFGATRENTEGRIWWDAK